MSGRIVFVSPEVARHREVILRVDGYLLDDNKSAVALRDWLSTVGAGYVLLERTTIVRLGRSYVVTVEVPLDPAAPRIPDTLTRARRLTFDVDQIDIDALSLALRSAKGLPA